jgi:isopenicillin N synthase-like dioxygenase
MSVTSFTSVPIVDISGLSSPDRAERERVADEIGRAAREVGFLYVSGSGLDESLFERMLAATKEFFALPVEEKMRSYIGLSRCHRGYVPVGEEGVETGTPDVKEAFDTALDLPADDPDYLAGNPMLGPNQWPDLPGMKEAVNAYYDATLSFGKVLLGGFAAALGEDPDRFAPLVTRAPSQLRLIHYPYDPSPSKAIGIGAHTDFEVFTLLRPTKPGLEVLNAAGEWIDAPPLPGAYVVNIGDMLEIWSNGEFTSTTHRVRKVAEERYAFPLFFNVDYDVLVEPLPRFVRGDGSDKLALKAGEHLYAQTVQVFQYLQRRRDAGEIAMPDVWVTTGSFGREAALERAQA